MSTRDAARILGVSDRYIRTLIEQGKLRIVGHTGRHDVCDRDVARLLSDRERAR
jgi:excisionase family DNA binding protein